MGKFPGNDFTQLPGNAQNDRLNIENSLPVAKLTTSKDCSLTFSTTNPARTLQPIIPNRTLTHRFPYTERISAATRSNNVQSSTSNFYERINKENLLH